MGDSLVLGDHPVGHGLVIDLQEADPEEDHVNLEQDANKADRKDDCALSLIFSHLDSLSPMMTDVRAP